VTRAIDFNIKQVGGSIGEHGQNIKDNHSTAMATLTPSQVDIIKSTVPILAQHGNAITTSFYDTLLKENPALNNVFNTANQANNHQPAALAGALYAYAANIDNLGALSPAVEKMCHKHASLHIPADHYRVVEEYLLRAMGDVLGAALTPEILAAWGAAYWQLANLMIGREKQLYEEAGDWKDWREFQIADKVKESDGITSFYLQPVDGKRLPSFLPGQYISVMMDVPRINYTQSRQYSLSDAPNPEYYRISVKKEAGIDTKNADSVAHPGYVSNVLHEDKQVGDIIKVSHPRGEFFYDADTQSDKPIVLLSAGVGITPMISILNTATASRSSPPISFIHGSRKSSARAFHSHVSKVAEQSNARYSSFIKNPVAGDKAEGRYRFQGRLDLDKLDSEDDLFVNNKRALYYICGPESFMAYVEAGLKDMGVEQDRIRKEAFGVGVA
jgi:nitric oxide dioxygenase